MTPHPDLPSGEKEEVWPAPRHILDFRLRREPSSRAPLGSEPQGRRQAEGLSRTISDCCQSESPKIGSNMFHHVFFPQSKIENLKSFDSVTLRREYLLLNFGVNLR